MARGGWLTGPLEVQETTIKISPSPGIVDEIQIPTKTMVEVPKDYDYSMVGLDPQGL